MCFCVLKLLNLMKSIFTLLIIFFVYSVQGQTFNVGNQNINFGGTGVTITNKVGNGMSTGDVVLYEDVITIGGQAIDAIVRTLFTSSSMINHDNPSTSGSSMTNNQARFFSPQFNFSGAGYADFRFEFILGGSYDNSTDSGTIVTLENVMINTYDIDGNGSSNTNQYNEFGGFDTSTLGSSTNIQTSYNSSNGLTTFRSNTSSNISNVLDDDTRVKVSYSSLSSFSIVVGAEAGGYAYFFIDFGPGASWSSTPDVFSPPTLDLDTTSSGINNLDTFCVNPTPLTRGATNLNSTSNSIDEITITFDSTFILDGSSEVFVVQGSLIIDTIPLNFPNTIVIPVIVLNGVSFVVSPSVVGTQRTLVFTKLIGTLTDAEAEMLLDSIHYMNSSPTSGSRYFDVTVRDGAFVSPSARYEIIADCGILPVSLLDFEVFINADNQVQLYWNTASEHNNDYFIIERSINGQNWMKLQQIDGNGTVNKLSHYSYIDNDPAFGSNCYRLSQYDYSEEKTSYDDACIDLQLSEKDIILFPNPNMGILHLECLACTDLHFKVFNAQGTDVTAEITFNKSNDLTLDLSTLPNGLYYLCVDSGQNMITKHFNLIR